MWLHASLTDLFPKWLFIDQTLAAGISSDDVIVVTSIYRRLWWLQMSCHTILLCTLAHIAPVRAGCLIGGHGTLVWRHRLLLLPWCDWSTSQRISGTFLLFLQHVHQDIWLRLSSYRSVLLLWRQWSLHSQFIIIHPWTDGQKMKQVLWFAVCSKFKRHVDDSKDTDFIISLYEQRFQLRFLGAVIVWRHTRRSRRCVHQSRATTSRVWLVFQIRFLKWTQLMLYNAWWHCYIYEYFMATLLQVTC